jgi:hypothetical protein
MAVTTIVVNVRAIPGRQRKPSFPPPNARPGYQIAFSEDIVLKPVPNQPERFVGIHSGILTLLRETDAQDRFYPTPHASCSTRLHTGSGVFPTLL